VLVDASATTGSHGSLRIRPRQRHYSPTRSARSLG
jgi:hypothetical protein